MAALREVRVRDIEQSVAVDHHAEAFVRVLVQALLRELRQSTSPAAIQS